MSEFSKKTAAFLANITGENKETCEKLLYAAKLMEASGGNIDYTKAAKYLDKIDPRIRANIDDQYFRDSKFDRDMAALIAIGQWVMTNGDKCKEYNTFLKNLGMKYSPKSIKDDFSALKNISTRFATYISEGEAAIGGEIGGAKKRRGRTVTKQKIKKTRKIGKVKK